MTDDRNLLDESGWPLWIGALVNAEGCAALYVTRGADPVAALRTVGARSPATPFEAALSELPPDGSRPGLLGDAVDPDGESVLLAVRSGEWTVVLDDGGWTFDPEIVEELSAGGEAVGCSSDINAVAWYVHAVAGTVVCSGDVMSETPAGELSELLRDAVAATGTGPANERPPDNLHVLCVLADLPGTLAGLLRLQPLIATTTG